MDLRTIYNTSKPVLSLEFFPPRNREQLSATLETVHTLDTLDPDLMTVTYGAMGGTRDLSTEVLRYIRSDLQKPAVAHLTCVGQSVADIDRVVDEFELEGVKNILALRGDPPKGADNFTPHPDGFTCARDLVAHLRKTRPHLGIAVAGYPEPHCDAASPQNDLKYLKEKVDAGADLIYTQLFFEPQLYFQFVERARGIGIEVPIIPGVMPIANVKQVRRFTTMCGASIPLAMQQDLRAVEDDPALVRSFGINYASLQCRALLEGGAPGIHLYTLNRCQQVPAIISSLSDLLKASPAKPSEARHEARA